MSTYVLMRILESTPQRYELRIRLLTLGHVGKAYERLSSWVGHGMRALDLGCGTGALTLRAAQNGATVKGIDISARMLEIAEQRAWKAGVRQNIELHEAGVAELEKEKAESYDVVMSGLCFSELSNDELLYTLKQVERILRPEGLLLVADQVKPPGFAARLVHSLIRIPLAGLSYIISQKTTHALEDLPASVAEAGLSIESVRSSVLGSFIELIARKPAEAA